MEAHDKVNKTHSLYSAEIYNVSGAH